MVSNIVQRGSAALTLIVHSGRPNGVQKLIIFVHMIYFSGFP